MTEYSARPYSRGPSPVVAARRRAQEMLRPFASRLADWERQVAHRDAMIPHLKTEADRPEHLQHLAALKAKIEPTRRQFAGEGREASATRPSMTLRQYSFACWRPLNVICDVVVD